MDCSVTIHQCSLSTLYFFIYVALTLHTNYEGVLYGHVYICMHESENRLAES